MKIDEPRTHIISIPTEEYKELVRENEKLKHQLFLAHKMLDFYLESIKEDN